MPRRTAAILIAAIFIDFLIPSAIKPAEAAGASLLLSPSSGEFNVGGTFTVKVLVSSGGGSGINAAEATVNFDPALLLVSKVSTGNSIFKLWTSDPTEKYSNKNGNIPFGGGSPSAYTGSAGNIFNITFVARKEGTANVTISSGIVLAADGVGTNVFSGSVPGVYTIKAEAAKPAGSDEVKKQEAVKKPEETKVNAALPPIPEVSSDTHPDENKWYSNNTPEFKWNLLGDITGVSAMLTDSPTSDPGPVSDGVIESKKFDASADGTHYFHVKFKNQSGWGPIARRKILIDTKPPSQFEITADFEGDPNNPQPILNFSTTDNISGIDHYSITIDGQAEDAAVRNFKSEPFRTKALAPGSHQIMVVAIDKALNRATSTKDLHIEPLKLPVITEMPKLLNKGEILIIRGTSFYPQSTITLFLGKDGKEIDSGKIRADNDGNWSYFHKKDLDKGNYEVWAKVSTDKGAESNLTERQSFTIVTPSLIQSYGWLIIIVLIIIIIMLALFIIYLKKKHSEAKVRIIKEVEEMRSKMSEVFSALKEEVDELIEFADKKPGFSESEKRVQSKLKEALDISEEFINKEVTDVEKELK